MPLDSNLITNPHFNITKGELPLQGSILTPGTQFLPLQPYLMAAS
jgi:hypothetical protein